MQYCTVRQGQKKFMYQKEINHMTLPREMVKTVKWALH
jgi:hypothetical protein